MSVDAVPSKLDPAGMALRVSPRAVTRLNRRVLIGLAAVLAVAVLGATLWSLRPGWRLRQPTPELYNVERVARAEDLDRLPKDYTQFSPPAAPPSVPVLGEPLPGDLGPAIVKAQQPGSVGAARDPAEVERLAAEEAARSPVFFRRNAGPGGDRQVAGPPTSTPASGQASDDVAAAALARSMGLASGLGVPAATAGAFLTAGEASVDTAQNLQGRKEVFLGAGNESGTRNAQALQAPASPYQVMAGTVIPAALLTGLNSDLPGQVIASVTQAVYDTATGRHLLIPQGSRLIGRYDSQVAFGQRRVLLVWTRLVLPDTSSIALDKLPGIDAAGYAGIEDGVNWHWGRILAGVGLSTLLGMGAELAAPDNGFGDDGSSGRIVIAGRDGLQDTVNELGKELTRRNLSVQPALTVRPGFAVNVMVNKDLVLRPYRPLIALERKGALR
ncbi:TrbI/VirB10 family protein [Variovorax sp.]|uniref:TrbI/VirB10 family protein n=1 Tax=Variovorax sp. TaxID=1871043 RepID=UPI0037DA2235